MSILFFLLSFICLLYFGVIVFYSGITTDFCAVWVLVAVGFALMGFFIRYAKKNRTDMPNRVHIFVYTTVCLAVLLMGVILGSILIQGNKKSKEGCDYVIVAGSTVYADGISTILKNRLDTAVDYSRRNPETVFILSGGKEPEDSVAQALAMYSYMAERGVPEEKMLIETDSLTTAEKMHLSLELIEEDVTHRMIPPPIVLGVLTSDYHSLRATAIAAKATDMDVFSIPAPSDLILLPHECIRECAAVFKDFMSGEM